MSALLWTCCCCCCCCLTKQPMPYSFFKCRCSTLAVHRITYLCSWSSCLAFHSGIVLVLWPRRPYWTRPHLHTCHSLTSLTISRSSTKTTNSSEKPVAVQHALHFSESQLKDVFLLRRAYLQRHAILTHEQQDLELQLDLRSDSDHSLEQQLEEVALQMQEAYVMYKGVVYDGVSVLSLSVDAGSIDCRSSFSSLKKRDLYENTSLSRSCCHILIPFLLLPPSDAHAPPILHNICMHDVLVCQCTMATLCKISLHTSGNQHMCPCFHELAGSK